MTTKKKGLGKGLANIYGDSLSDVIAELETSGPGKEIAVENIRPNPYQPRRAFSEESLQELADSIATHGVFTPLLIREALNGYELVAGERRLRAAKMVGLTEVPAIVVEFDDQQMMEISLLENIQRENLNAIEEAGAYQTMIDKLDYTQELLAKRLNKSRSHITNLLRLLKLPKSVRELIESGKISAGHARPLIGLEVKEAESIAEKVVNEGLSVRQVEALVSGKDKPQRPPVKTTDYRYVEELLMEKLQTAVKISDKQIVIKYQGINDLNRLLELWDCLEDQDITT